MLALDSKYESEFACDAVADLGRLGVEVIDARHAENSNVLNVVMRLPSDANVALRRQALQVLSDFEHRFDFAIVTDPAFVWDNADA